MRRPPMRSRFGIRPRRLSFGTSMSSNQAYSIVAVGARDIVIDRNSLEYAGSRGSIVLNYTENTLISRNVGVAQILTGWAGGGNNTRVVGNDVSGGEFGIKGLFDSNLTITGNNVSSQSFAAISLHSSSNVIVVGNRIANSVRGVYLDRVTDLLFAQNDVDSNGQQVDIVSGQRLAWNETYPDAGNHWSDYAGTDLCSGPQQDLCLGPDGIGDTPYVIDANDEDHLPRMPQPSPPQNIPPPAGLKASPETGNTPPFFRSTAPPSWEAQNPVAWLRCR